MKDVDSFSSKLQLALEELGTKKGAKALGPLDSQDPADQDLHEYFIAKTGEAVMKKRAEKALGRLTTPETVANNITRVVSLTRKSDMKETASLVQGQHYTLTLETRKPSRSISTDVIAAELQKMGWSSQQVAQLFEKATKVNEPAKTFRANPIRE